MKNLAVFIALLYSQLNFAQTPNYIEISVGELIKLGTKSVDVRLYVSSAEEQANQKFYYENEYSDYDEEDYYYEIQMQGNPKSVTKEMKKKYEDRMKAREKKERAIKTEKRILKNNVYKMSDLRQLLEDNQIIYEEVRNQEPERYGDDEMAYEVTQELFYVVHVESSEEMIKLNSLLNNPAIFKNYMNITRELFIDKRNAAIPGMTEKAAQEATVIATSMNRKLGKVLSCSNVILSDMSYSMDQDLYRNEEEDYYRNNHLARPFGDQVQKIIRYVYRFELLN